MKQILQCLFLFYPAISFAKEVDSLYRSSDFVGRGNAGISDPIAEDALFYNPANLESRHDPKTSIVFLSPSLATSKQATKTQSIGSEDSKVLDFVQKSVGKPIDVAVDNFTGFTMNRFGLGLIASGRLNALIFKDPKASGIETLDIKATKNIGFVTGMGFTYNRLQVGAGLKFINRWQAKETIAISSVDEIKDLKLSDISNSGNGIGMDLGTIYTFNAPWQPSIALTVLNIGDTRFKASKTDGIAIDPLYQTVNLGFGLHKDLASFGTLKAFFDISDLTKHEEDNKFKNLHMGLNYHPFRAIGINLGLNQGYGTAGIYFDSKLSRLDVGAYTEEVGSTLGSRPSQRYFARLVVKLDSRQERIEEPVTPVPQTLPEPTPSPAPVKKENKPETKITPDSKEGNK